jgi:hypothetical protein
MRLVTSVCAFAMFTLFTVAVPLHAQSAPRVSSTLPEPELTELSAVRKAVWVDWFSGDTAALRRVLTPELVAISAGDPRPLSLEETIAASADFRSKGGRFVSVSFNDDAVHRFGDAVVMFSRYAVVTENGGRRATQSGRATEVFVRANGRWVHTSWHLDDEQP